MKNKILRLTLSIVPLCLVMTLPYVTYSSLNSQNHNIRQQFNNNTLGKQPSFVINGGWNHSQINNFQVEPMPRKQPLGALITKNDISIDKDSFLFQMDELKQNAWTKNQWYSLREAILNPAQQLISNIKIGFGKHDSNTNILSWGQIGINTHYWTYDQKISQNIYAINDNQWDKNNGRWDNPNDPLIGSSFTWSSSNIQYDNGNGMTATGNFDFTIDILDVNKNPISLYDCVQIKQNDDLTYGMQFIKDVTSSFAIDFNFNDDMWINPTDATSTSYVDDVAVPRGEITDTLTSSVINTVPNVGCVMTAQMILNDEEKSYFESNPSALSQSITLDENHFKFRKFDGFYISDEIDGKDAVLNYFRQYKAVINETYTFLLNVSGFPYPVMWPGDLNVPTLKLTTSPQDLPSLTLFNFTSGYKDGFLVNSSIVFNTNFVLTFSYTI